jgi:hypothetical protein
MAQPLAPGVYQMPAATYHARPELSSSGARRLLETCPAKFLFERNNPPEPTNALDVGSAAHEWLLEGETWPQRHGVLPEDHNGSTKIGKERVAAIEADGKRPLKWGEFETIKAMVKALREHPFAHAAFANGKSEQSLFWHDDDSGVGCRCRLDFLPDRGTIFGEYKTTRSAHPTYLQKAIAEFGYHQQVEWNLWGIRQLKICRNPSMVLVFQEKEPPYLVTCVVPHADAIAWAEVQNRKARHIFAECSATGIWPGYVDDVTTLNLPPWSLAQLIDKNEKGLFKIAMDMQAPINTAAE